MEKEFKRFSTIGELKKLIKDLPDDTLIVSYKEDIETRGYSKDHCLVWPRQNFKEVTKQTWDRFDGIDYSYKTLEKDKDGNIDAIELC